MNWTQSQKNAIEFPNSDVLVSAAAGSGKTATLTERVLRAVMSDDPRADIRRMLIVTYTNKAAAELRTKVRKKLEEKLNAEPDNANIRRQLNLLPSADICTIHSFYIKLLQKNFAALGLPPKIGIGDDSEFMQIKKSLCNELIEAYYEGDVKGEYEIEDPASFFALFSGDKTDEDLWETFTEFYSKASSYREFLEFYNNCAKEAAEAAENFSASRYYRYIRSYVVRILILYRDKILSLCDKYLDDEQFAEKYHPVFESCTAEIERAVSAYKTLGYKDAAAYSVIKPTFPKFPRVTDEPEFKKPSQDLKDELKPKLFNVIERIYSFSEEQTAEICRNTAKVYSDLYKFLSNFDRLYTEKKLKIKKLGYDDLERYACRLLCGKDGKPTKEAIETGKRYDRIFIDEYQDVNSTQDAIFAAISHNDRFMVGDIKQSIYGFRGAEPAIFAEYRKNADNEDNKGKVPDVLFLADNFRCGKPVVDYTNFIFKKLFGADTDEIPYSDEESLVFSKTADDREDVKVRIHISVGENRAEDEKEYIAEQIEELVNNGRNDDGKAISYGDIAVLCRKESGCTAIEKKLKEKGIPVTVASKKGFFNAPEVILAVSLLTAIDNPMRDIPLASVMRSPLFGFSAEELALIRRDSKDKAFFESVEEYAETENGEKCRQFIKTLEQYRKKSRKLSLEKFIRYLFGETAVMTLAFNKKDRGSKEARKANLRKIYDLARNFESGSFGGLSDFVAYCDDLIKNDKSGAVVPATEEEGCVTVQTVHKSKGLEYPAVFLYATNSEFEKKGKKVVVDRQLGPAVKTAIGGNPVCGPIYDAVGRKYRDDCIREEMRLLYVGVTRARKYLYITGKSAKLPAFNERASLERIMECKSHQDMICLCTPKGETDFSICEAIEKAAAEEPNAAERADARELSRDIEFERKVREELAFVYPHKELSKVPNKVAVSKLYPSLLDEDETVADISADTQIPILLPGEEDETDGPTASSRGTATHLFMQFCDLDNARQNVEEEAARLLQKGYINKSNADIMYVDELKRFFGSDLYKRMNSAKKAGRLFYREFRFNIGLDAADFTTDAEMKKKLENETLLVQGVIDCFFEEEDGTVTVCDYKTDRVGRNGVEDFKARHRLQLTYYKKAIERITKKKVGKLSLYSFCLGEEIPV